MGAHKAPRKQRKALHPEERKAGFQEVSIGLSREDAIEEAGRCLQCKKPKCIEGCPAHAPVPDYVLAVSEGDFTRAYAIIRCYLPIPGVLGRVCPAFCEDACILGKKHEPIAIRDLKRAAVDFGEHWIPPIADEREGSVAIIGAGPAGLTVAADLREKGYKVKVFDRHQTAGGTLIQGIPTFRLPREVIGLEVDELRSMGIEFQFDTNLGRDFNLEDLFEQGYDAVFIGVGAMAPKRLNIEGEELEGVASAAKILTSIAVHGKADLPPRVSIIGCGNVAVDIARSAVRLGSEATILYRRTITEAPAHIHEIEEAKEEGVDIHFLVAPTRVIGDESGKVVGVECLKMELGEPDDSGRRRPVPVEGTEFVVPTDMVVPAVSQAPELEWLLPDHGVNLERWGTIQADDDTGVTSHERIFAAGDVVLGPSTVIEAINQAHKAADGIHRFLSPEDWERERLEREAKEAEEAKEEG